MTHEGDRHNTPTLCGKCGTITDPDAMFCAVCGTDLVTPAPQRTGTLIAPMPAFAQASPPAGPRSQPASVPISDPAALREVTATEPAPKQIPNEHPSDINIDKTDDVRSKRVQPIGSIRSIDAFAALFVISSAGLLAFSAIWILGCLISINAIDSLARVDNPDDGLIAQASLADAIFSAGAIGSLVFGGICALAFIVWLWRAHTCLSNGGSQSLRFARNQIIWTWVIPILGLFRPYQLVADVARGSQAAVDPATPWRLRPGIAIVGWWWAAFLVMSLALNVLLPNAAIDAQAALESMRDSYQLVIVGLAASLPCSALGIIMVMRVAREQASPRIASA